MSYIAYRYSTFRSKAQNTVKYSLLCTCQCQRLVSGYNSGGSMGVWVRGFNPPSGFFFFACQYMKIPTDLDPNPPPPKNSGPEPPPRPPPPPPPAKEFLDPSLYKTSQSPTGLVGRAFPYPNQPPSSGSYYQPY